MNPKIKVATHVMAGILVSVAAFFVTPAGMALVHQYPALAPVATALAAASLYFNPKSS